MSPGIRKLALTAHVASSVAWMGAVAVFLALAITGITSADSQTVRSVYVAAEITGWRVIVPLSFAGLVTGILMGVGTHWGLLRHYWVATKLLINIVASYLLLSHMQPVGIVARLAARGDLAESQRADIRITLIVASALAIAALAFATLLSVFKPWGLTPVGVKVQEVAGRPVSGDSARYGKQIAAAAVVAAVVLVIIILIRHG